MNGTVGLIWLLAALAVSAGCASPPRMVPAAGHGGGPATPPVSSPAAKIVGQDGLRGSSVATWLNITEDEWSPPEYGLRRVLVRAELSGSPQDGRAAVAFYSVANGRMHLLSANVGVNLSSYVASIESCKPTKMSLVVAASMEDPGNLSLRVGVVADGLQHLEGPARPTSPLATGGPLQLAYAWINADGVREKHRLNVTDGRTLAGPLGTGEVDVAATQQAAAVWPYFASLVTGNPNGASRWEVRSGAPGGNATADGVATGEFPASVLDSGEGTGPVSMGVRLLDAAHAMDFFAIATQALLPLNLTAAGLHVIAETTVYPSEAFVASAVQLAVQRVVC